MRLPFCRAFDLASSSVFCLRFASKLYILEAIECWPFFDPKSRDMTSLKRHFLKKILTDFPEILCEYTKLMLNKLPQVSRRYLPSFLKLLRKLARGGFSRFMMSDFWSETVFTVFDVKQSLTPNLPSGDFPGNRDIVPLPGCYTSQIFEHDTETHVILLRIEWRTR